MSEQIGAQMERRRAARSHMIQAGRITSASQTLDCILLDVSAVGARVYLQPSAEVPERSVLTLPDGTTRLARTRWRQGEQVGFEFLG